ncbi:MAG: dual specificity protein phosphatase family protein [Chloroflexi bacterium]|nr:dual specificity protein phosphatase family protein [Chloroflexota bacterium]
MDWITKDIAVGAIEDALDYRGLRARGITGVLCLNGFPTFLALEGFAWRLVEMVDGMGNPPQALAWALAELRELARSHRVLVHCSEGVSRSPFVVACHLAMSRGIPLEEGIEMVRQRRPGTQISSHLLPLYRALGQQRDGDGGLADGSD